MTTVAVKDATGATQNIQVPPAIGTAGTASADVMTIQGIASMTAVKVDGSAVTQPVSGTFWQATQPVSAASLPLPTGAATAAKQPALGTAGTASSDVISVQGIASMTALKVDGSAVTQPVSGTVTINAIPTGANTIGNVGLIAGSAKVGQVAIDQTTPGTTNLVSIGTNGTVAINAALPAGTNLLGKVGIDQTTSGTTNAVVPALPAAANGLTSSRVNAAASTNATSLKASAGNIGHISVFNTAAYSVFLKLYNKASAPTVGTDTPTWTIPIAAGTGFSEEFIRGKSFATGIAYAITKLQADSDTTVVVAGDLTGSIDWV